MRKNIHPTESEIATRAYQIYVGNGCQPGHAFDNWLQAEYELLHLPVQKLAQIPPPNLRRGHHSLIHKIHAVLFLNSPGGTTTQTANRLTKIREA